MTDKKLLKLLNVVLRGHKFLEHHGCLDGDCPHDKQHECWKALLEDLALVVDEARGKIDTYREDAKRARETSERHLKMFKELALPCALAIERMSGHYLEITRKVKEDQMDKIWVQVTENHERDTITYRAVRSG